LKLADSSRHDARVDADFITNLPQSTAMAPGRQSGFMLAFCWLNALFTGLALASAAADSTAFDGESILHSEIGRQNNQSLLWGPYRPNLYFGVRPRIPKSLMTGLMWGKVETYNDFQNSQCTAHYHLPSIG
jgi:mannosyl-oligosaccharide glucosidase